ncbi:hypothetical protein O181_004640 [Austropuccinia psidii MF-1]|uniref:Uncharacterized protein n=1 Tax=Austropuccinia psidii MF-1 TaxID=1389203 RepID=A0A9Q3BHD2_9BASI|nr:hypothetical protein [Austropuccinia psidii MF-1]
MEFPAHLDLHRVVYVQVGLSTIASASVAPAYNLPIHLYGLYNIENDMNNVPGANEGLRKYCILLAASFLLDIVWIYHWSSSTSLLPFILIFLGLIIKPISLFTCLQQVQQATNSFGASLSSHLTNRQMPFQGHNATNLSGDFRRGNPAWANSPAHPSHSSVNAPPPGPSPISHQATAALEFSLDGHADAQNLSDQEVLQAKRELDSRIAQKKQQLLQQQQQSQTPPQSHPQVSSSPKTAQVTSGPMMPIDGNLATIRLGKIFLLVQRVKAVPASNASRSPQPISTRAETD